MNVTKGPEDYSELLASVFRLMLMAGFRKPEIAKVAGQAIDQAQKERHRLKSGRRTGLITAALILDTWHRHRRYLDRSAHPKPIPLYGPAPSVEALIRAEHPRANVSELIGRLKSLKLIARASEKRYKPTTNLAVIKGFDPLMQQYAPRCVATLLGTIKHNIAQTQTSRKLIERFAEVPDLPVGLAMQFRRFSEAQGGALLKTMNDWLESRRARGTSRRNLPAARAGIHVYAYFEPRSKARSTTS